MFFKKKPSKLVCVDYLAEFQCLGKQCPATCCIGWNVAVDRQAFPLVEAEITSLKTFPPDILVQNMASKNPDLYGKLQLQNTACPLLTAEGLCSIQLQYGEKKLPKACYTFPRVYHKIIPSLFVSARLSCPEIARLALGKKEGILCVTQDKNASDLADLRREVLDASSEKPAFESIFLQFEPINSFVIEILQNRSFDIEKRLCYVVLFIEKLALWQDKKYHTKLSDILQETRNCMKNHDFPRQLFSDLHFQYEFLIGNIVPEHIQRIRQSQSLRALRPDLLAAIETCTEMDGFAYEKAIDDYYLPFISAHPYLFENLLVNWSLNEIFPLHSNSLYYEVMRLVIHFSLLRFLLMGKASQKYRRDGSPLTEGDAVQLFFEYVRSFGNTQMPKLKNAFRENTNAVFDLLYMLINTMH